MSKELIKENVVEAPTLFVGVGGTGSGIVTKVAEMCRPGEVENINFVCLDTNVNDLSNVAKSKAKIYFVQTSNTQTVGSYLDYDEDARRNWFPKNAVMYDKTVSEGAGQVRAISRLALNATIKTGAINPLYDAIDNLFRKSGKQMKQALRVVVVSTASGGTGSGIILPLCMFIRDYVNNKYPNTALIVRSMIMLPETLDSVIKSTAEKESQRRNAYATIKELNAFMIKGSGFMDIEGGELEKYKNLHVDFSVPGTSEVKALSLLPCDFCFLMDGQDSQDTTMISIEQYKKQAAQALYEQNIGPMQKRAFSVEDNIIKELANPGNFGRNRFGGIGAAVIKFPYDEVTEYIGYGWAMDSIGGEGESAKWTRYDKKYQVERQEGKAKGLSDDEMPKLPEVYIKHVDSGEDVFTKNVRVVLRDPDVKISAYCEALIDEVTKSVIDNNKIKSKINDNSTLESKQNYNAESNRNRAVRNVNALHSFEQAVRTNVQKIAENRAESIFSNDIKTVNVKQDYKLETLIQNADGIFHPNAMRYMLYKVLLEFEQKMKAAADQIDSLNGSLRDYGLRANLPKKYNVDQTKDVDEKTLDDFAKAEADVLGGRKGQIEDYYKRLNSFLPGYYTDIMDLMNAMIEKATYEIGYRYVKELCEGFEKFYGTFADKCTTLVRSQEDLVNKLKFQKGDSVYHVCASEAILKEMVKATRAASEGGAMLDSDLNGKIFDAIKDNVAFEREIRYADVVENDQRVDIFDDIMLDFFVESVRTTCDMVNVNVIEAIALENRLTARIKLREQAKDGEQIVDKVTLEDS
ncbi:MAG: tubulin-like doman-containing protein, partial [Acetatifactor sp.]|nr:tubulin-like doman-containing protein [Acetatifactor sp.]